MAVQITTEGEVVDCSRWQLQVAVQAITILHEMFYGSEIIVMMGLLIRDGLLNCVRFTVSDQLSMDFRSVNEVKS